MSSSLFKDEKRTQYSPLMTREEQVRDRDDGRRATMGRRETIWLDDADETSVRAELSELVGVELMSCASEKAINLRQA